METSISTYSINDRKMKIIGLSGSVNRVKGLYGFEFQNVTVGRTIVVASLNRAILKRRMYENVWVFRRDRKRWP